jgi:hypothetical protein
MNKLYCTLFITDDKSMECVGIMFRIDMSAILVVLPLSALKALNKDLLIE